MRPWTEEALADRYAREDVTGEPPAPHQCECPYASHGWIGCERIADGSAAIGVREVCDQCQGGQHG